MRAEEEVHAKIVSINIAIVMLEDAKRPDHKQYVHQLKQEVCLLKWVLEPEGS